MWVDLALPRYNLTRKNSSEHSLTRHCHRPELPRIREGRSREIRERRRGQGGSDGKEKGRRKKGIEEKLEM